MAEAFFVNVQSVYLPNRQPADRLVFSLNGIWLTPYGRNDHIMYLDYQRSLSWGILQETYAQASLKQIMF